MRSIIRRRGKGMGFTLVELVVSIVVSVLVVVVIAGVVLPSMGRPHCGGRQIKDSTQVRGVHQGMVMWAQNNKDRYPWPSEVDKDNLTVDADAASKDTTSNIMSLLIYNGFFGPELCVSPAESSGAIKQMTDYEYGNPKAAVNPAKALWDPHFNADFTGGKTGNFSYAHIGPFGERVKDWENTFSGDTAVVGNRGPKVSGVTYGMGGLADAAFDQYSNTRLIHGSRTTWEGNIVYNDNHVNFETRMAPEALTFKDSAGAKWGDCLFFDEPEDVSGRNAYLSIWTRSGATPADWTSIWD